ncbi:MAG: HEAT repeat domain-containing protein [Desulfamplus sp.]|nr:HEAT repeat domain-containing protein [Desulfamplus sp.]
MDKLIKALESEDEAERLYAVQDISEKLELEPARLLSEHLAIETSRVVREATVFQLKHLNCKDVYPIIFELFTSSDAYLRNAAVDIFGAGDEDAIAFLTAYMDHSNREVRKLILDALFAIGTQAAILAIRAGLYDKSINVCITAVEYLGRLEDKHSAEEIIALLNDDPEPMLKTAVLDILPRVASESEIAKALSYLIPQFEIQNSDPLFIPEILHLVACGADQDTLCKVLKGINDLSIYADDFLRAIIDAQDRCSSLACNEIIVNKLIEILKDRTLLENTRHTAGEIIIASNILSTSDLEALGMALADELDKLDQTDGSNNDKEYKKDRLNGGGNGVKNMAYTVVRLLAASGTDGANQLVQKIMESINDDELKNLCAELFEQ